MTDNLPRKRSFTEILQRRSRAIIILAIFIVAVAIFSMILIHNIAENRRIDAAAVTFNDQLTIEFGTTAKASDFIAHLNGEMLNDPEINTHTLGEQEITFEFYNIKHKKRRRSFTINVIDSTAPVIYGNNSYTVYQGYDGDLTELMLSGDNVDDTPVRTISGEYNLERIGSYALDYVIHDASGNETHKNFQLHVVEPPEGVAAGTADDSSEVVGQPLEDVIDLHKSKSTKIGIDVSSWQGKIDWQKAKHAGVEFAFIRVGYQPDFGADYVVDKMFSENIAGATEAGLPLGVYFYSCADSVDEAKRQAEWVRIKVQDYELALGVAFDWEEWQDFNRANVSFYTLNRIAQTFLDTLSATGYTGMLYGSTTYVERFWQLNPYTIWLAQYHDHVTYDGEYAIWQLTDAGEVPGIDTYVDLDVLYLPD